MSPGERRLRYGAPIAVAVLGVAWAALDTNRVGNTAGTVLIAVGLIAFMVLLGRDLGMSERTGRAPVPPPRPPGPPGGGGGDADGPPGTQASGTSPS